MVTTLGDYGLRIASVDAPQEFIGGSFAKCNGSSDVDVINDAIDWVSTHSNYGGKIHLSPGQFSLSSGILLRSGVNIHGSGRIGVGVDNALGTELKVANLANAPAIKLFSSSVHHVELRDFWVNGNKANQKTPQNGIEIDWTGTSQTQAARLQFFNVGVYQAHTGFSIVRPSGSGGGAADFVLCMAHQNDSDGFSFSGTDIFVSHCISLNNAGRGYVMNSVSAGCQVSNSKADSNGGVGFHVSGAGSAKLFGFEAGVNESDGIRINQDNCVISGYFAYNNGDSGNLRSAVDVTSGVSNLIITGMTAISDNSGMDYAVDINSSASGVYAQGISVGAATAAIRNSSNTVNGSSASLGVIAV